MSLVNVVGAGLWIPMPPQGYHTTNTVALNDSGLLDADLEEFQMVGTVTRDGGGSATFGTSGSKIDWLPGASITFAANSTLTAGVKKTSTIDKANGPPGRATAGKAAFDVYKDLVGGTDTITSTTARSDTMASGTPYTVTDGDELAVCFLLSTTAGSPSIKVRQGTTVSLLHSTVSTLITASGGTFTAQLMLPNVILTFDDGSIGWLEPTYSWSTVDVISGTIGNTNIFGNIFQVPYACKIDALAAVVNVSTSAADYALDLYSTPLGTPALVEACTQDANTTAVAAGARLTVRRLTTPRTLTINTDYAIGVRQTTATAVSVVQRDVQTATFFKPSGMGAECYAANSTAAATFAAQNSGKRRYHVYARVSALDNGVSAAGAAQLVNSGGLVG